MENKIVKRIKNEFQNTPDLVTKNIRLSLLDTVTVLYLETVSSSDKVNDYILKNLSSFSSFKNTKAVLLAFFQVLIQKRLKTLMK